MSGPVAGIVLKNVVSGTLQSGNILFKGMPPENIIFLRHHLEEMELNLLILLNISASEN